MPTSAKSITFGGKEYILPPKFNLRELRDLCEASTIPRDPDPAKNEAMQFDIAARMIAIATRRCETPITEDDVYLSETSVTEVVIARLTILGHSELLPKGEPKKGEAQAAA